MILTNQRTFDPMGLGWTLLQELPLTDHNVTNWVREVVGLGVALGVDDATGAVLITDVFLASPADDANLKSGLVIEQINGVAVRGKPLADCLELMAGSAGTKVRLHLTDPEGRGGRTVELTKRRYLTAR